jgi:hypothetical protein
VKKIAVLSNVIPDAWFEGQGITLVREAECSQHEPVTLRAGMCGYLAFLPALLADVDGVVLTTTCDQMRRAAEWLDADDRVFLFNYPSTLHQECLIDAEKARLKMWLAQLAAREKVERFDARTQGSAFANAASASANRTTADRQQDIRQSADHGRIALGVIGGHFCGERQAVENFFAQRGVQLALWGCEGGESVGDVAQRPNDAFYEHLKTLVTQRHLEGLIVVRTTWCDLWRLASVRLHEVLQVPVLEWVMDGQNHGQPFPDGASRTRLEAFCELLQAQRQEAP